MFRPATRSLLRKAQSSLAPGRTAPTRRFLSTDPPHLRSRSWRSSAARWGLAIAGVYYYNTSPVFAEEPSTNLLNPDIDALEETFLPSIDSVSPNTKRQYRAAPSLPERIFSTTSEENASATTSSGSTASLSSSLSAPGTTSAPDPLVPSTAPSDLEEEADSQGAFNSETGEINWDCPCLGGMAHGPCGPNFREAFSCFVFSKEEPKGLDCVEKFKGMQDCFREHPDVYKAELEDDENDELDEGLRSENEALAREVQERRSVIERKEKEKGHGSGEKRLLEEEAPEPSSTPSQSNTRQTSPTQAQKEQVAIDVSKESYTEKETDTKVPAQAPSATTKVAPSQNKATEISRPASSEPHPGTSSDHAHSELRNEERGARRSRANKEMNKFDQDLELMPKPWHDARDTKVEGKREGK